MVARGDVLDLIDERVGPQRDNGNAAFIHLDRTGSPDGRLTTRRSTGSERTPVRCSLPGETVTVLPSSASPS